MSAATDVITVRIPAEQKAIIDSAAQLLGKSRTAFILDLAVRHAEDVLAEKTHFHLSPEQWDAFTQRAVKPRPSGRGYKAHLDWNFCL